MSFFGNLTDGNNNSVSAKELRDEGHAGILYANDENGNAVYAGNAEKGVTYYCPFCHCKVHLTTSPLQKKYFARFPGEKHTNSICEAKEKKGVEKTLKGVTPKKFFGKICNVPPERTGHGPGPVGGPNGPGGGSPKPVPVVLPGDILEKGITSLSDLFMVAAYDKDGTFEQSGVKLADFLLTYKNMPYYFYTPDFKMGARALYVKHMFSKRESRSFIFKLFTKDNFSICFCLYARDAALFDYFYKMFQKSERTKDGISYVKIPNCLLIASDEWKFSMPKKKPCREYCMENPKYCPDCSGIFTAPLVREGQIFICPEDVKL